MSRSKARMSVLIVVLLGFALRFSVVSVNSEPKFFDVLTGLGFMNVANSSLEIFPPGTYNVSLLAEFASYNAENNLSWYLVGTTSYNTVFLGSDGNFGYVIPPVNRTFTANATFGLSLATPENHRYFTENSRNPDYLPNHLNHSLVLSNLDNPNMHLIGFENLYGGGDKDFQDMIISLEFIAPLPIPVGGEWIPLDTCQILVQFFYSSVATLAVASSFIGVKRTMKKRN